MNLKKVTSHRVFKNASALAVMQMVNYIVPLLVLLHLTSVLGVELYGVVAFVTGLVLLGFVVMDFGYSLSATNKISLNRDKFVFVGRLVSSILMIKLALFLIVAVIVSLYAVLSEKYSDHQLIILLALIPILFQGLLPIWFFQGIERMKNIAAVTIFSKVVFFIMIFFILTSEDVYWYVPLFNGIAQFFALILAFFLLYQSGYKLRKPRKKFLRYALAINRGFFSSRIAVASYMQAGTVLLGLFSTPAVVAFYSLAEQLYKVMQSAISPIVQALYPYMSKERNYDLYIKVSLLLFSLVFVGAAVGFFTAPFLINAIFGVEWLPSVAVLNVFFVAILVHVLAVLMGYPICSALGQLEAANQSVVVGGFLYFAFFPLLYFSDYVTAISIAVLMIFAELYVLIHRSVCVLPKIKLNLYKG